MYSSRIFYGSSAGITFSLVSFLWFGGIPIAKDDSSI